MVVFGLGPMVALFLANFAGETDPITVNTMFYMEVQRDKLKMPIMNIIMIAMIIHKLNLKTG